MDINITKGKWIIDSSFYDSYSNMWVTPLRDEKGKVLQRIYGVTKEESESNANLIAASPRMYEVLQILNGDIEQAPVNFTREEKKKMIQEALKLAQG